MMIIFTLFVAVTALLHVMFFKLESVDFMKARVLKRFGLNHDQGVIVKVWAFNQGFYNLFLAFGLFYSLFLVHGDRIESGIVLAQFILVTLTGAGFVLLVSAPKKYPAALAQSVPALLGFVTSFFL